MHQYETISTDGQPLRKRLDFWNRATSDTLATHDAEPADVDHFSGSLTRIEFGDARLAQIRADASTVTRSRTHVSRSSEAHCLLRLQMAGAVTAAQEGREIMLRPGDFALYDTTRPYRMSFHEPTTILALRIRRDLLLPYIANPDAVICKAVSSSSGTGALVASCLQQFWKQSREISAPHLAPRYLDIMLRLVASAYAALPQSGVEQSCRVAAHRVRAIEYIEQALKHPTLTPTSIAQALRMTPSYLHRVFMSESESVARYILRRRLDECRKLLMDPMQRGRSITAIAVEYGFSSPAHFSRTFRDRFGVSPRDLRA